MTNILVDKDKAKFCPLCHKPWFIHTLADGKSYFTCVRPGCMISIRITDKFVGLWEDMRQVNPVPCPNPKCGKSPMRFFIRSDSYAKWCCEHCGASVESEDPEKHKRKKPVYKPSKN